MLADDPDRFVEVEAVGGRTLLSTFHASDKNLISRGFDEKLQAISEDIQDNTRLWDEDNRPEDLAKASAMIVVWMLNDVYKGGSSKMLPMADLESGMMKKLERFINNVASHPVRGVILGGHGIWWNDDPGDIKQFDDVAENISRRLRAAGIAVFDGSSVIPYTYRSVRKTWHMNAHWMNVEAMNSYILNCLDHCIADSVLRASSPAVVSLNDWAANLNEKMEEANLENPSIEVVNPLIAQQLIAGSETLASHILKKNDAASSAVISVQKTSADVVVAVDVDDEAPPKFAADSATTTTTRRTPMSRHEQMNAVIERQNQETTIIQSSPRADVRLPSRAASRSPRDDFLIDISPSTDISGMDCSPPARARASMPPPPRKQFDCEKTRARSKAGARSRSTSLRPLSEEVVPSGSSRSVAVESPRGRTKAEIKPKDFPSAKTVSRKKHIMLPADDASSPKCDAELMQKYLDEIDANDIFEAARADSDKAGDRGRSTSFQSSRGHWDELRNSSPDDPLRFRCPRTWAEITAESSSLLSAQTPAINDWQNVGQPMDEQAPVDIKRNPQTVVLNPIYQHAETVMLRVLRHSGPLHGVPVDAAGWASVSVLYNHIHAEVTTHIRNLWATRHEYKQFSNDFTVGTLRGVVEASHCHTLQMKAMKSRAEDMELRHRLTMVRAIQGHTIDLDDNAVFGEKFIVRPDAVEKIQCCVHCTREESLDSILKYGLKSERSLRKDEAHAVGKTMRPHIFFAQFHYENSRSFGACRDKSEIAIYLDLKKMIEDNYRFYCSANDSLVTRHDIPPEYIIWIQRTSDWAMLYDRFDVSMDLEKADSDYKDSWYANGYSRAEFPTGEFTLKRFSQNLPDEVSRHFHRRPRETFVRDVNLPRVEDVEHDLIVFECGRLRLSKSCGAKITYGQVYCPRCNYQYIRFHEYQRKQEEMHADDNAADYSVPDDRLFRIHNPEEGKGENFIRRSLRPRYKEIIKLSPKTNAKTLDAHCRFFEGVFRSKRKFMVEPSKWCYLRRHYDDVSEVTDSSGNLITASAKMRAKMKELNLTTEDLPKIEKLIMEANFRADRSMSFCPPLGLPDVCRWAPELLYQICQVHNNVCATYFTGSLLSKDMLTKLQERWEQVDKYSGESVLPNRIDIFDPELYAAARPT